MSKLGLETHEELSTPRGHFQQLVRELAEAAQSTLYHDIDSSMPEYIHGVQYLEPVFSRILRGKVKARAGRADLKETGK